jgi:hypothetical protein
MDRTHCHQKIEGRGFDFILAVIFGVPLEFGCIDGRERADADDGFDDITDEGTDHLTSGKPSH